MKSLPFLGSCSYITTYYHPKRYKSRGANNVFILHAYRPFWHFFPQRSDLAIQDLEFQSLILIYKPELQVGVGSPSFLLSKNILQLSKLVGRPWLTKSISAKMVRMVRTAIFWVSACLFFAMAVIDMVDFFLVLPHQFWHILINKKYKTYVTLLLANRRARQSRRHRPPPQPPKLL